MTKRYFEVHPDFLGSNIKKPQRATARSAGYDIVVPEFFDVVLEPYEQILVPTGLMAYMQDDEELQIRPRSGLALKHRIQVANSPATIDADYFDKKGHIQVIILNHSEEPFHITPGMKIAQAIFGKYLITDDDQPVKQERVGGFNSTGTTI